MNSIHKIDGFGKPQIVHQDDIDRSSPAHDEYKSHDSNEGRHIMGMMVSRRKRFLPGNYNGEEERPMAMQGIEVVITVLSQGEREFTRDLR